MNTSEELFDQLRAKFSDLTMGNVDAESTTDPTEAQFFTFEYKDNPVSIALGEKELSIYYSRSMTENQPMSEKSEWYGFIQDIRKFAKQRNLGFDVRDISKSNLEKKDYKYLAQNKIAEARTMYGTSKTSYHPLSTAKVIIKHTKAVDEDQVGSRSRNISAIFIQNEDGERFKYPYIHLGGARAMARHVANGGYPYDDFGKHIQEQSKDLAKLRGFQRYINRNDLMNNENNLIVDTTLHKINTIKNNIHKLTTQRGYGIIKGSWQQTQPIEMTKEEIAEYKEKLTKKTFDEAVLDVLPIIHQAIKEADAETVAWKKREGISGWQHIAPMKPGEDETTSAQKNKAYVDAWLKDPNNQLILKPNDAADNMLAKTKFKDKNIMIASILRDIATRFLPANDEAMRVNNFAADMDSEIQQQGELFVTQKKDYPQLKATAIMLVKKYINDLKKIKADPKYKEQVRKDPQELKKFKNIKGQSIKKDMGKYYKRKYREDDQFDHWASGVTKEYDLKKKDNVEEGTWAVPDTKDKILDIKKLMKEPLPVGVDGENAQGILYDLIGSDTLFDDLYMLAQKKGPEADARQLIRRWMEHFIKQHYDKGAGLSPDAYGSGIPQKGYEPTYDAKEPQVPRQMKNPKRDLMVSKGGKTIVIDKSKEKEYLAKGWELAEDTVKEGGVSIGDYVRVIDQDIEGEVIADHGNKIVIKDVDAETEDDELEFHKSEVEVVHDPKHGAPYDDFDQDLEYDDDWDHGQYDDLPDEDFEFKGLKHKKFRRPIKGRHKLKKENDLDRIRELAGVKTDEYSLAQVGKNPQPRYKEKSDPKYAVGSKKPKDAKEPYLYKKSKK